MHDTGRWSEPTYVGKLRASLIELFLLKVLRKRIQQQDNSSKANSVHCYY